ncbi:MAG: 6-phosphogluconolactonase [Candidatus Nomurabacteria bacterium]|nr:MAG: 6-phosphogluconolactonase [Candidatus Nomurabacteria bacterium]
MSDIRVFDDPSLLAKAAAKQTVDVLKGAIETYGSAVWVLAGGSTPLMTYRIIAANHENDVDWSKVTVILGDERVGRLDGPDSNWHAINEIIGDLPTVKLRPLSDQSAENAAKNYSNQLSSLPKIDNGLPRFDLVWLGVGQDGHTLSLFPGHNSLLPANDLVIPVHDSPKPPRDRISLSLRALQGAATVVILAAGADKKRAVTEAQLNSQMPIGLAVAIVETHEGSVHWLVDTAASPN